MSRVWDKETHLSPQQESNPTFRTPVGCSNHWAIRDWWLSHNPFDQSSMIDVILYIVSKTTWSLLKWAVYTIREQCARGLGQYAATTRSSLIGWENNRTNNRTIDPNTENNRAAWYPGPIKLEVLKWWVPVAICFFFLSERILDTRMNWGVRVLEWKNNLKMVSFINYRTSNLQKCAPIQGGD